ncbi:MAG: DsbA family protein [Microthrixaceae bacterium]
MDQVKNTAPQSVAFHFDIMCPYAFQTSLWMREVRDQLGIRVDWRFFSLEEVNRVEGKKHPWERDWSYGWSMMRIGALLRRINEDLLDSWYLRAGTALHIEGRKPHRPEVAEQLLRELDLDPSLVRQAIEDPTTSEEVLAEHRTVLDLAGWGVPTLVFEGLAAGPQALFGPVLIDPPSGQAAVDLWRAVTAWLQFPQLYELQRPKRPEDLRAIVQEFTPYFEARDWVSMQNETP